MDNYIYMDNAATTKLNNKVFEVMKDCLLNYYGNPSSIYSLGRQSKQALDEARVKISKVLNVSHKEIYFTSGGTESNNWAIRGIVENSSKKRKHIITSKIEHKSVLNTFKDLEKKGYDVTYLDVDSKGVIDLNGLENSIREDTVLISLMLANNETGVIQPIAEVSELIKDKDIYFHTDAVQGAGKLNIDVETLGVDLLSISAHKFHGPKGVGALFIKKGTDIKNILTGGAQERGLRPGTENVASIMGMSKALTVAEDSMDQRNSEIIIKENYMMNQLKDTFENVVFNGLKAKRLPGYINIAFKDISSESLLMNLDIEKICASSGSACTSGSLKQSHVIKAMGLEDHYGVLRFSLNEENTTAEIDYVIEKLKTIINRLS